MYKTGIRSYVHTHYSHGPHFHLSEIVIIRFSVIRRIIDIFIIAYNLGKAFCWLLPSELLDDMGDADVGFSANVHNS